MVFNGALSIPTLDHSFINPNKLRHHQIKVQEKPFCGEQMHMDSPEGDMVSYLKSEGTCIFFYTWTPSHRDLDTLTHVVLTSTYPWVPQNAKFPELANSVQEEVETRRIASISSIQYNLTFEFLDRDDCRELHGFCEIEGLPEDITGEDYVLINVSEVFIGLLSLSG